MSPDRSTINAASPAPSTAPARARASCSRCHKRKKSFEDDNLQTASYPIAYIQALEEKVRRLGAQEQDMPRNVEPTVTLSNDHPYHDFQTAAEAAVNDQTESLQGFHGSQVANTSPSIDRGGGPIQGQVQGPLLSPQPTPDQASTFGQQLTAISLEAAAERHLGSTSGLSFAKLTQIILRRLTPDKADFVFNINQNNTTDANLLDLSSPSDLFNDSFYQSLSESISVHPLLFGDLFLTDVSGADEALDSLAWPSDEAHVRRLVDFYFAHSHTLYPILNRSDVMDTLEKIHQNPQNLTAQPPLDIFRVWMVLAIGSTAYSSVMLTEESESTLYYTKALQYSEQALGSDEMVGLGLYWPERADKRVVCPGGHHAPGFFFLFQSTGAQFPLDTQQRRKRVFFSIYMMDRIVSITLGRPFALHDDDIDVTPFENVDEEFIHADCISPQNALQPSVMAVPLHILSLRRIAGKISKQVYGNMNANLSPQEREAVIVSLHQELVDWRRSMPFPLPDIQDCVPHLNTTWYDFNYYTHLAMIYRPSPLCPVIDLKRIKILEMAASMSLRQAYSMHQQQRFAYNWLNFLSLFTATLSLVYSITAQPDDLSIVLRDTRAIADLDLATQLFETLGIKFQAAKKVQGMIAEISRRYKELRAFKEMERDMGHQE
ncbi:hypothetical protein FZEAL_7996 [Fusarium zealandicum]|uniref:Xylanolytic transcriptional activator regulatory domain-containing protein n=1 Tax=Fusarium zealandicum TaxID=1053134 RepID=A0A8H4UEN4_9HYPO|nr:hypothetical protein FZEAL_7996 [Fusarium zealandicum]